MVKQYKKINKNKTKKSKSKSRHMNKSKSMHKRMRGGDLQGFPPSYFGNGLNGYFPPGSSELTSVGKQLAVSQGTISADGTTAGPNLFQMQIGAGCGCKKKYKKNKTSKRIMKTKSKKSKRH